MSTTLYHGPAGAGKTEFVLRHLLEKHVCRGEGDSYFLIVPFARSVEVYQKRLLEELNDSRIIIGDAIVPFDRFLFRLLKLNLPRVHRCTSSITRNIVRKLLFKNNFNTFEKEKYFSGIISALVTTFISLKKNGLDPNKARELFKRHLTPQIEELIHLFGLYQEELRQLYYFDEGDLYLEILKRLREGRLELPEKIKTIYLDRLFPLSLGQREILKELANRFPQIELIVSYSFDFQSEEDPYLYPSYSFLGEWAHQSEYFHLTHLDRQENFYSFTDPATESEWVVEKIKQEIEKGMSPDRIGILLPAYPFYHRRLSELLLKESIPFYPAYSPPLTRYSYLKPEQVSDLIKQFLEQPLRSISEAASALAQLADFEKQWEFERSLILGTFGDPQQIARWKNEELSRVKFKPAPASGGVALLPLSESLSYDFEALFIVGFTDRHYPSSTQDHPFCSTEMLLETPMREILGGPTFRQSVEKNHLLQILQRTRENIYFSYPKILWDRKEQFPSRLYETEKHYINLSSPVPSKTDAQTGNKTESFEFPHLHRKEFSISEIDTYRKCPYQYYARYHLKLGQKVVEEIDVPPDVRGNFVHRVMQRLVRDNLDLYGEAVEYDLYVRQLIDRAKLIIEEEKRKDAFLTKAPETIRELFCQRVLEVIAAHLREELAQIRNKKKKTRPRYFEWAFGKKNVPPLRLKVGKSDISISGRIDRIDVDQNNKVFSVIDYKTGELDSGAKIKRGESLQIPLYMMAAEQLLLKNYRPAAGLLIGFKDLTKKSGLIIQGGGEEEALKKNYHISMESWNQLKQEITMGVQKIVDQINEGRFTPNPLEKSLCRFCDYRDICHFEQKGEDSE